MISRHFAALAISLSVTLAACGGGEDNPTQAETPTAAPVSKLLVLGNSLALHGPAPSIGWTGNWGMAASEASKDYPHVTASTLGAALDVRNYAADTDRAPQLAAQATPQTVVVVQLAENLSSAPSFLGEYTALLQAVKAARTVVCVGSWWPAPAIDAQIQAACTAAGGKFVGVADLKESAANTDKALPPFANPAVNEHPRDWGQAQIAARIVAASK